MANALQIKADIVNELRNKIYYGQIEIQRLVNNPAGLSHKKVVDTIIWHLKENLVNGEAINLIESYIPTPQAPTVSISEEEVGIKKID